MTDANMVWRLRRRPTGTIADGDLTLAEEPMPAPADGQVVVRLNYLSLDPTNLVWMKRDTYMPAIPIDDPMRGIVCGTVVRSQSEQLPEGAVVSGLGTWADYQLGSPETLQVMADTGPMPVAEAFGTFAVVGPTAYVGLMDIGQPKEGETLVVSGAAGAVGSIAGQIGRIQGMRVVGVAGTDDKCAWITDELGFDAAVNYRTGDLPAALAEACPDGVDVYFDNVGGPILDATLGLMNVFGRVVVCGQISQYTNDGEWSAPSNYRRILTQRLKVQGFIILDHFDRYPEAIGALAGWMAAGELTARNEIVDGIENAVDTCNRLFSGEHSGKLLLRVAGA
ncbi:MAG: NADP-dependent oxidoreductase [Miltoncostaeaceae bacterium]